LIYEVIVGFVDVGVIVDYRCINFLFITLVFSVVQEY
jgi:hypothetical protein